MSGENEFSAETNPGDVEPGITTRGSHGQETNEQARVITQDTGTIGGKVVQGRSEAVARGEVNQIQEHQVHAGEGDEADTADTDANDTRQKRVSFANPYKNGEIFKKQKEEAEKRKLENEKANEKSVFFGVKFTIQGAHKDGKEYTSDTGVLKLILKGILAKAKDIDDTAIISPWIDNLHPLKSDADVEAIRADAIHEYLFTPRIKKGQNYVRKEVRKGYNVAFAIRLKTDGIDQDKGRKQIEIFQNKWNKDNEGAANFYVYNGRIEDRDIEISVRDLAYRPIQGKRMMEVGYLHASVRGMDMDEIIERFQNEVNKRFQVRLGSDWAQPEIGKQAAKYWREANQYEGKERMGRAPLIQIIYAEEENYSRLGKIAKLLHELYGQYEEIQIRNKKGTEYTEYMMNKLPDGSRGIFFPAYELQSSKEGKQNVLDIFDLHIQLKLENSSWISTNLNDPDMFFEYEGDMVTIREYLLGLQAMEGVFLFHNMTTYVNPRDPEDTKVYLICNNQYKQGATQKYNDTVEWLLERFPELTMAFDDEASVGDISAFSLSTRNPNMPETTQSNIFKLQAMIEKERKRLNNVVIEGKRIKEDRGKKDNMFEKKPIRIMKIQNEEVDSDDISVISDEVEVVEVQTTQPEPQIQTRNTAVQINQSNQWTQVAKKRQRITNNTTINSESIGSVTIGSHSQDDNRGGLN